ncbi:hypothetical protein Tco_0369141 [Tanacetum coccineum]
MMVAPISPSSSIIPVPSTSPPPVQSPPPYNCSIPPSFYTYHIPKLTQTFEHTFEEPSPAHQQFSLPQEHAQGQITCSGEEQVEDISPATLEAAKTLDPGFASLKSQSPIDKEGGVNTAIFKVSTVSGQVSTDSIKKSIPSPNKGQREGKAPMIIEEALKKTKEKILQEEASLSGAIRLDTLEKEKEAKQVHLDSLLVQRLAEEEELNEQQKKRRAQVQFEAQHYTDEDWDLIRAKIEANAELLKSVLGSGLQGEDFAKKMVKLVSQRKKHFAEERARDKKNKPMIQSQLRTYMMNYLKNQGTWKLSQLKNLSFEEVKEEFDKLVKQVESFAPINFKATKDSLKRFGEELQTKTSKRLKSDEAKDDELTKKTGKRRKQITRKGLHTNIDKDDSEDSDEASEQDDSASGMILTELYKVCQNRYGMKGPEDMFEKGQQRIISWRYYDTCRVHYLNLESMDIYMLIERKYPLSAEVCKAMLDKKLQGEKPDEDCYKMLKMMEKQAGIRK